MSPTEQLDIMIKQEKNIAATQMEPNRKDLEASFSEFNDKVIGC